MQITDDARVGMGVEDQLCFAAYSASRALVAAYHRRLRPLGLTYTQYLVLLVLWEHPTAPMRELGRALDLDSGTLTPVLQRMEAADLVERHRGTTDERTVEVTLTDRGRELLPQVSRVQADIVVDTGLSSQDLARLRGELHDLAASLESAR